MCNTAFRFVFSQRAVCNFVNSSAQGKFSTRGTILPWLYGRRSKQGVQQPRHGCGRKLLTFSPGLKHAIVGHAEPPGAAKEVVGVQKKLSVRHVPGTGYQEVSPLVSGTGFCRARLIN